MEVIVDVIIEMGSIIIMGIVCFALYVNGKLFLIKITKTPEKGRLNAWNWSLNCFQLWKNTWCDKETTIGKIIIIWAIIIAVGEYNKLKTPNKPPFATKKYTIIPTTTGGIPIKELKIIIIIFFRKKLYNANI